MSEQIYFKMEPTKPRMLLCNWTKLRFERKLLDKRQGGWRGVGERKLSEAANGILGGGETQNPLMLPVVPALCRRQHAQISGCFNAQRQNWNLGFFRGFFSSFFQWKFWRYYSSRLKRYFLAERPQDEWNTTGWYLQTCKKWHFDGGIRLKLWHHSF